MRRNRSLRAGFCWRFSWPLNTTGCAGPTTGSVVCHNPDFIPVGIFHESNWLFVHPFTIRGINYPPTTGSFESFFRGTEDEGYWETYYLRSLQRRGGVLRREDCYCRCDELLPLLAETLPAVLATAVTVLVVAAGTSEVPQVLAMEGMKVMLGGVSLCVCGYIMIIYDNMYLYNYLYVYIYIYHKYIYIYHIISYIYIYVCVYCTITL